MNIISPMATGNGAFVLHSKLAQHIPNYRLHPFHPYWTLFPPILPLLSSKNKAADIIHTTPDHAFFFAKQNVPLVVSFHNYVLDAFMRPYSSTLQKIYYSNYLKISHVKAISLAHTITAVSNFTALLAKKELNIDEKRIQVIHNGIDEKLFYPQYKSNNNDRIKVLFAGNPTLRKGVQWLDDIANQLDENIEIIVTGGLRNKGFSTNNPRISIIGKIEYCDMPDLYNQVDILLSPTVREGFALSVLEAMACGLPVVATNCSSLPEQIIDKKGGYLCPIGDTHYFADRINELAASPGFRREIGEFNRARVEEKFSLQQMLEGYNKIFTEAYSGIV